MANLAQRGMNYSDPNAAQRDSSAALLPHSRTGPLNDLEMFVVTNFMDDPAIRQKFLAKHGLEMNPKDPNQYRPNGSGSEYYEIDPGFEKQIRQNGFAKGFMQEVSDKIKNNTVDLTLKFPLIGAASSSGAIEGAMAGGATGPGAPVMSPVAAIGASVAQGAAAALAANAVKHQIANWLAETDVPQERWPAVYQALMDSAGTQAAGAVAKYTGKGISAMIDKIKGVSHSALDAMKRAIGNGVTDEQLVSFAKKPELIQGAKTAGKAIINEWRDLHGIKLKGLPENGEPIENFAADDVSKDLIKFQTQAPESVPQDSVYGRALKPLRDRQASQITELSANPAGDFTVSEFLSPMNKMRETILAKQNAGQALTPAEESSLSWLNKELPHVKAAYEAKPDMYGDYSTASSKIIGQEADKSFLQGKAQLASKFYGEQGPISVEAPDPTAAMGPIGSEASDPKINYGQARSWLTRWQQELFQKDMTGNYVNPAGSYMSQALGGGDGQLLKILDQKALSAGSKLPQTNAQMSNILTAFNATKSITPNQIALKMIPGADDWGSVVDRYALADQALGRTGTPGSYATQLSDLAQSKWVDKLSRPKAQGSLQATSELAEALGTEALGHAAEAIPGAGPLVKAGTMLKGAMQSLNASKYGKPEDALIEYIAQSARNAAPESSLSGAQQFGINTLRDVNQVAQPVIANAGPAFSPQVDQGHAAQPVDEWAFLDGAPSPGPAPAAATPAAASGADEWSFLDKP